MTPMSNYEYLSRVKFAEELEAIEAAKKSQVLPMRSLLQK